MDDVAVAEGKIGHEFFAQFHVVGAGGELDRAAATVEGRLGDEIDNAADGIAVEVGRRGLDDLDRGDGVGREIVEGEGAGGVTVDRTLTGAGGGEAGAVKLHAVEGTVETADVDVAGNLGAAVRVGGDAGDALERLRDVVIGHLAEQFFGGHVLHRFGDALLIDGAGLAENIRLDLDGFELDGVGAEEEIKRRGATGDDLDRSALRIEAEVGDLDFVAAGGNGAQVETAIAGGVGAKLSADNAHDGALQRLAGG